MNKAVITITEHNELDAKIRVVFEGQKESVTFARCQLAVSIMKEAIDKVGAEVQDITHEQYASGAEGTTH